MSNIIIRFAYAVLHFKKPNHTCFITIVLGSFEKFSISNTGDIMFNRNLRLCTIRSWLAGVCVFSGNALLHTIHLIHSRKRLLKSFRAREIRLEKTSLPNVRGSSPPPLCTRGCPVWFITTLHCAILLRDRRRGRGRGYRESGINPRDISICRPRAAFDLTRHLLLKRTASRTAARSQKTYIFVPKNVRHKRPSSRTDTALRANRLQCTTNRISKIVRLRSKVHNG